MLGWPARLWHARAGTGIWTPAAVGERAVVNVTISSSHEMLAACSLRAYSAAVRWPGMPRNAGTLVPGSQLDGTVLAMAAYTVWVAVFCGLM